MTPSSPRPVYRVILTRPAEKDLAALDAAMRERVTRRLRSLADNPRGTYTIKLSGQELYRARAGTYRIVFTINDTTHTVAIDRIEHRREAYRRQ